MPRILYDAFFHQLPGHRLGDDAATGGYAVNTGRYAPDDCFHPNGLAELQADLAPEHELRLLHAPYSDSSLFDADILLIANPDYPLYEGAAAYRWTPRDVDALLRFLERGGGVLLLINSFLSRPDFWEENFDLERVSLLFDRLGIRWDADYMSDDTRIEPAQAGDLRFGYGQGGRVKDARLPEGAEPLITFEGNIYGFAMRVGAGTLAVVGDAGSISNGLFCYPDFDNAEVYRILFARLRPGWLNGARWDCQTFFTLSAAPGKSGLTEETLCSLQPEAAWTVDHHFRHLTWSVDEALGADDDVWTYLPLDLTGILDEQAVTVPFHWAPLDGRHPTPAAEIELTVQAARGRHGADLLLTGRTQSEAVAWSDLCPVPERLDPAGKLERIHAVFLLRAVLDSDGKPLRARWSLGQNLYARHPNAVKPGYARLLNSRSGVILPRCR